MSKNIYLGANVELSSDTFASWADKTNQIIDDMGKVVVTVAPVAQANSTNGAMTVGNAHIQGVLSALQMSAVELRGGTMSVPAPLVIGTDLVFANTNVIDIGTNANRLKTIYTVNAIANLVAANVANIVVLNANTGDVKTLTSNTGTIQTLSGNTFNFGSGQINSMNVAQDVRITGNLTVSGVTSLASNSAFSVNTSISEYLIVQQLATINGNTIIGEDKTKTLQINAGISADIIPNANNTINLGSALKRFGDVNANRIQASNVNATSLSGNGSGITNINASSLATGTVPDARLPGIMSGKQFSTTVTMSAGLNLGTTSGGLELGRTDGTSGSAYIDLHTSATSVDYNARIIATGNTAGIGGASVDILAAALTLNGSKIWTANNDGHTSGLDADLLDGLQPEELPISTATQTALNLKANLASPAFTGTPTAPTQTQGNNSTRLATTAYVDTGLGTKQENLGFTPVQQGGGAGQGAHKIYIGYGETVERLLLQVNAVDFGNNFPININGDATTVGGYTPAQLPISTPTQTALNTMQTAINGKANTSSLGNSASKNFYYGTAVPASSFGAEGDIYFRYE